MPIGVSANSRASFWAEMKDETTKYDDCVLISFFSPCLVKEFSLELKSFRSNVRVANDIVFHLSEHAAVSLSPRRVHWSGCFPLYHQT